MLRLTWIISCSPTVPNFQTLKGKKHVLLLLATSEGLQPRHKHRCGRAEEALRPPLLLRMKVGSQTETLRCKLTKFKTRSGNRVILLGSCHLACQHLKSESVASTLGVGISNLFISKSLHLHPQLTLCQKEKKTDSDYTMDPV